MTDLLQRDFSGGNPVLVERLQNTSGEHKRQQADWVRVECDGWCLEVAD